MPSIKKSLVRTELEELMNKLVDNPKNGIKGIFVFAPDTSLTLLTSSISVDNKDNIDFNFISNHLNRLNMSAINQSGFGTLEWSLLKLSNAIYILHSFDDGFKQPLVLSFICDDIDISTIINTIESYLPTFSDKLAVLFGVGRE